MSINNNPHEKLLAKLLKKLKNLKSISGNNAAGLTLWRILLAYSATTLSSKFLKLLAKLSKKSKRKKFLRRWLKHMQEYNEQQHLQQEKLRQQILATQNNMAQPNNYLTTDQTPTITPQYRNRSFPLRYNARKTSQTIPQLLLGRPFNHGASSSITEIGDNLIVTGNNPFIPF